MDSSKKWIIALVIVLIAGCVAAFFLLSGGSSTNTTDTSINESEIQQTSGKSISAVASSTKQLNTLTDAVKAAGLTTTLEGTGPFTVLAPTNDAFKNLPDGILESLLKPENSASLESILKYHVIVGNVTRSQLTNGQKIKTVNGQELVVEISNGTTYFIDAKGGKAKIVNADITASNGTVHAVSAVLLPQ